MTDVKTCKNCHLWNCVLVCVTKHGCISHRKGKNPVLPKVRIRILVHSYAIQQQCTANIITQCRMTCEDYYSRWTGNDREGNSVGQFIDTPKISFSYVWDSNHRQSEYKSTALAASSGHISSERNSE